jgi:hypothetical protein
MSRRASADSGVALVIVVTLLSLLLALGLALTSVTLTETTVAGSFRDSLQVFYAAESAADYGLQALGREPDWAPVLAGSAVPPFRDPSVLPVLGGAVPDGVLYAYGWFADLLPFDAAGSRLALAIWAAPDPDRSDRLLVTGRAYGLNGARRTIEVHVERTNPPAAPLRVVSWREVR